MASIRKRGKVWYVEIRKKGVYECATFQTKAEATEWASDIERKIRSGKYTVAHNRTFGDMLERYLTDVSSKKATHKWETNRINWFLSSDLNGKKLIDVSPAVLALWRDERLKTVSNETVRRDITLLSHAFNIAINEWGWLHDNPIKRISRPKPNQARERIATEYEIDAICQAGGYVPGEKAETTTARVAAAFVFSVETGMRSGEICGLRVECPPGTSVRLEKTKNGTARDVPLSANARQVLIDVGGCFDLTGSQRDALFRKLRDRAAISGLNFHDARHTAITRLARKLNPLELARMVGHRDLKMLLRYYNESADEIAKKLK